MNASDGTALWITVCYDQLSNVSLSFKIMYTILSSLLILIRTASVFVFPINYIKELRQEQLQQASSLETCMY